jgi:hypothetical protein
MSTGRPLVEIQVTHEHGPAPGPSRRLGEAIEIWTVNHVYVLNAAMQCIEVRAANTGVPEGPSGFLGAFLVGGQHTTTDSTEISYPFPRPGAVAVFETRKNRARQYHHTSPVERVLLRLSIRTVTTSNLVPTWEQISRERSPAGEP